MFGKLLDDEGLQKYSSKLQIKIPSVIIAIAANENFLQFSEKLNNKSP